MSYMHINNLYKNTDILLFRECYAMEKIHGTLAHISWNGTEVRLSSGGVSHKLFEELFDIGKLTEKFTEKGLPKVVIFGEAYGGKCQKMRHTYGDSLKFVAFEVKIDELWLSVPLANQFCDEFNIDFVPWEKVSTDLQELDRVRMRSSEQAVKCGITEPREREGIVLRPLIELKKNNGSRIIVKHKNESFSEVRTPREIDPNKQALLEKAEEIVLEWVTEMRLTHVLQNFPDDIGIEKTGDVIKLMVEDVEREADGEIITSKEVRKAISVATAKMFKKRISKI